MQRMGFILRIRPGTMDEYRRRHASVYEDLLEAFKRYGIHTYSIFMHETTLFAYMEVEDFDDAMAHLAEDPANQRWQAFMSDLLVLDQTGKSMHQIPEVFHFES